MKTIKVEAKEQKQQVRKNVNLILKKVSGASVSV